MAESTPQNQSSMPIRATNRPQNYNQTRDELVGPKSGDDIISRLEGTPSLKRGSRKQPSIMKYPQDIGQSQVPHIMQFKIFWRWERPDLKNAMDAMKAESAKTVEYMNKLSEYGVDANGIFSVDQLLKSPLTAADHTYMEQILQDKRLGMIIDPSGNSDILGLLKSNPTAARSIIEQTVKSESSRVSTISEFGSDLLGKVGADDDERLAQRAGLNEEIANADPLTVGVRAGAVAGAVDFFANALTAVSNTGSKKAAFGALGKQALKSGAIGLGVGVAAGGAAAALKYGQAAPVYDQMVSVYLPICTKINQTEMFQYKDASMAVASGAVDMLSGSVGEGLKQAGLGIATKLADTKGLADAVGAISGRVLNPRLEKLFQTKGIRDFNFSWDFYPRNAEEVANIRDIVETFRYHSHPAISKSSDSGSGDDEAVASTKIMLRVPAEFEVRFMSSSNSPDSIGYEENPYIPKIGRCVVTNITIDYSPNGVFSTFGDNAPTAISFSISVSEVSQMTRETVERGY